MRLSIAAGLMLSVLATSEPAHAERVVEVDAGQVLLGQVWTRAPESLADLQVGHAPPAGGSRLIVRAELVRRLTEQGAQVAGLSLPQAVRIKTRADQWSTERLADAARASVETKLRSGITLKRVVVRSGQMVPAGTVAGDVQFSNVPRRVGEATVSGTLLLQYDGQVVRRVPVSLFVEVSEAGAVALVTQGTVMQLVVEKSSAQISALAEALQEADVGEVVQFRVQSTRRVVFGQVESAHRARLVTR